MSKNADVKVEKTDYMQINALEKVTVVDMGHLVQVRYAEKLNKHATVVTLGDNKYMVVSTGEVKEYGKNENRAENANGVRKTMNKLRYLINNNFRGNDNELFLTLTYAENMKDVDKLYKDFEKFMKKLKYKYKEQSRIEYLRIAEPQGRGAWHLHVLVRFEDLKSAYIANDELRKMWGHGFVKVKRLDNVDNVGAYLTAYLTDMEITNDNVKDFLGHKIELLEKEVDGIPKKFVKGARLRLYPVGMNIYTASRGIKHPEQTEMYYRDIKKVVGTALPNYSTGYVITTDDGYTNRYVRHEYNLKRD